MKGIFHGVFYFCLLAAIVLIVATLFTGCNPHKEAKPVTIVWKDDKAVGLIIRKANSTREAAARLEVRRVKDRDQTAILGAFQYNERDITFTPVVPFTRGLKYEVIEDGTTLGVVEIPASEAPAPQVLAIYPTADTVPENLLKVYVRFSQPMMEGRSASYVHLLKDGRDTMNGTFLDLQPELWNEEGNVLTLWLDPGRIKLDLIPNKTLGNPLQRNARYDLVVGAGWRSKDGVALTTDVRKGFFVGDRDDSSPDVNRWRLGLPNSGTREPLQIDFGETLDRMLIQDALSILDAKGKAVMGQSVIVGNDNRVEFTPDDQWKSGEYVLRVESRLEDLAGNNLNRLFETDLSKTGRKKESKGSYELKFSVLLRD